MEEIQSYPNLLSEKQAASRLGIARITLLRAREAGRVKFFRIGTRVLYCEEQLTEFLTSCERNCRNEQKPKPRRGSTRRTAKRKENQMSGSRASGSRNEDSNVSSTERRSNAEQTTLPFAAAS